MDKFVEKYQIKREKAEKDVRYLLNDLLKKKIIKLEKGNISELLTQLLLFERSRELLDSAFSLTRRISCPEV